MKPKPFTNAWMFERVPVYRGTLLCLSFFSLVSFVAMIVSWL